MPDRMRVAARKRRPHLAISCAVAGLALAPAGWMAVVVGCLLAATAGRFAFGVRGMAVAAGLVIGAATFGGLRIAAIERPATAAPPGTVVAADATLLERPRAGLFGFSAVMQIDSGPARGLRILARTTDALPASDPGVRFRMHGFVRDPNRAAGASAAGAISAARPGSASGPGASASGPGASASGPAASGGT